MNIITGCVVIQGRGRQAKIKTIIRTESGSQGKSRKN
jgi:hypothetical protein